MAELCRPERLSAGNHGLFQMSGLKALAWQFPGRSGRRGAAAYALANGVGAPRQPARAGGRPHRGRARLPFLRGDADRRASLAPPGGRCRRWRPSGRGSPRRATPSPGWSIPPGAACRWATPPRRAEPAIPRRWRAGRMCARERCSAPSSTATASCAPAPRAVPRSTLVFLMASHHLEAHKHADCLSLIWQDRGETLLIDSGKYGYQRDRMRRYFQSTRAHNTVEVDGRDWSRATADAYGCRHAPGRAVRRRPGSSRPRPPTAARASATAASCSSGRTASSSSSTSWRRARPPAGAARLAAPRPAPFTAWWHFGPGHAVEDGGAARHRPRRRPRARRDACGGRRRARASLAGAGQGGRRPQGWVSRSYGSFEPAPALGFAEPRPRRLARRHPLRAPRARRRAGARAPPGGGRARPRRSRRPRHGAPAGSDAFALDIAPGLL